VLSRFANPFLRHFWHDISLNGLYKFKSRNLDLIFDYIEANGSPPPLLTLSLAAWLRFYLSGSAKGLAPHDSSEVLSLVKALGAMECKTPEDRDNLVAAFLSNQAIWGRSIDLPALRAVILEKLDFIDEIASNSNHNRLFSV
jgi:tagaturonate reductase